MNKPSHSLGGLQELELFSLFASHFHIQIAVGLNPVFVDFHGERSDQAQSTFLIRKDANTWVRRFSS